MSLFKNMLHELFPSKNDVQIWDCDPLLILDDKGAVAFSKRTEIEWHPSEEGQGHLYCLSDHDGWKPDLEIEFRQVTAAPPVLPWGGVGFRQGVTLLGHDAAGNGFTWYIAGAADEFLTTKENNPPPYSEAGEI